MSSSSSTWFARLLGKLVDRVDLNEAEMGEWLEQLLTGSCGEAESAALLVAMRMKVESAHELAAAARFLRERMIPFTTGRADVLDTCGTGGDGTGTFNISTATALVVAGAGVPVIKHGNRAVSSRSGSADVLEELGVRVDVDPEQAQRQFAASGLAFCLAPRYHPGLRHVGPVRRRLGIRTMFNSLGPLVNPARAPFQLLGVGRQEWLEPMAHALALLGDSRHALLVWAEDGLDEISLAGGTRVCEVRGTTVRTLRWTANDFGLDPVALDSLRVSSPGESAALIEAILRGERGPALDVVLANAAAGLLAAGRTADLLTGVALARQAVESGKAHQVLQRLREVG